MLSLFLTQHLMDALKELASYSVYDPESMLAELKAEEDARFQNFRLASLPENSKQLQSDEIGSELLFKGPNICHTARTPAQTRYLGYLTDSGKVGGIASVGNEMYDTGISMADALSTDANGVLRLAYDPGERTNCHIPVKIDYKDFFFASQKDGWVKLTLPNRAEREVYGYDPSIFKGLIVIFFGSCDWGKCKPNDLHYNEFKEGRIEFEVNGKRVVDLSAIPGAYVLKGEDGVFWKANDEGVYDFRVRVISAGDYVRFNSIVLY